jgi:two-component system, LytTR family, response regulator
MDRYSCIIVDDEPKAIKLLKDQIETLYSNIDIVSTYTTWKTAFDALRKNDVDILFMDISMPQKNGINLLKLLPELRCEIIFVTAYSNYAIEAFEFKTAGYILKPVEDVLLAKTIDRAIERIMNSRAALLSKSDGVARVSKLAIPCDKGFDYVNIEDIIYFEAVSRYTKVITPNASILSSYSIGKFGDIIHGLNFFHIHRSFIINLQYIRRYRSNGTVVLSTGIELPVARDMKKSFLAELNKIARNITLED